MCSISGGAQEKERQDETSVPTPQIGRKTSLVLEFSFLVTRLMPYYAKTGGSHPVIARFKENSNM